MTHQNFFIFYLLVGSIIFLDGGIRKFKENRIFFHKKMSDIFLAFIFALLVFIQFTDVWKFDYQNRSVALIILMGFGALFIYRLSVEFTSSRVIVYDIDEEEVVEFINLVLVNLGVNFEYERITEGKNIFQIHNSKSKIIVKDVPVFGNNKQVLITHDYDFSNLGKFLLSLKEEVLDKRNKVSKLRGIGEILVGAVSLILAISLFFLR